MPAEFGRYLKVVSGVAVRRLGLLISGNSADDATAPTLTAGTGAPTAAEANGSLNQRTNGYVYRRIGDAWELLAGAAGALTANVISELTAAAGVTIDGLLVKDGGLVAAGAVDANGQELILDADADTSLTADTDDQIDVRISGADDFRFTANTFTALSGSTIAADTIAETTAASGVTVDGCLIKDGRVAALAVASMFSSTEQTGTGSPQNVAHGLGTTPSMVWTEPSELPAALAAGYDVAKGAHDATNCIFTVTSGVKFFVHAIK